MEKKYQVVIGIFGILILILILAILINLLLPHLDLISQGLISISGAIAIFLITLHKIIGIRLFDVTLINLGGSKKMRPELIPYFIKIGGDNEIGIEFRGRKPESLIFHYIFLSKNNKEKYWISQSFPNAIIGRMYRDRDFCYPKAIVPEEINVIYKIDDIWKNIKRENGYKNNFTDTLWILEGKYKKKIYAYAQEYKFGGKEWESINGLTHKIIVDGKKKKKADKKIKKYIGEFHPELVLSDNKKLFETDKKKSEPTYRGYNWNKRHGIKR